MRCGIAMRDLHCRIWRCGCGYLYWKNVFRSPDNLFAFCSCHRHRVVVNFYTQMVEMQRKETLAMFMDQLERLPELSREELENISRKVRQFR